MRHQPAHRRVAREQRARQARLRFHQLPQDPRCGAHRDCRPLAGDPRGSRPAGRRRSWGTRGCPRRAGAARTDRRTGSHAPGRRGRALSQTGVRHREGRALRPADVARCKRGFGGPLRGLARRQWCGQEHDAQGDQRAAQARGVGEAADAGPHPLARPGLLGARGGRRPDHRLVTPRDRRDPCRDRNPDGDHPGRRSAGGVSHQRSDDAAAASAGNGRAADRCWRSWARSTATPGRGSPRWSPRR